MRWWMLAVALFTSLAAGAHAGSTLDAVRGRGHLTCGISGEQPGLSEVDARGGVAGLEADVCRAVAAAIFGSADKVAFRKLGTIRDFLESPDVDIVVHGLTWTFARETNLGVRFGPVVFYDGQALLTRRRLGASTLGDLARHAVCVRSGGGAAANLQRTFAARNVPLDLHVLATRGAAEEAFFSGQCDVLSDDATELASALLMRRGKARDEADYVVLPERLSKEPLAPLLRRGDDEFFDVVRWTVFVLIEAEELGLTSRTPAVADAADPRVRDFHATASDRLGLRPGWANAVIRAVGNYGEVYDRHYGQGAGRRVPGEKAPAILDRGPNELWRNGGLMFAPPIR